MVFKIAMRKILREKTWSLAILGLLIVGLTTWMVVPSISASLQQGVSSYANGAATYIYVYSNGYQSVSQRIPQNVTNEISSIPGVKSVYPVVENFTYLFNQETSGLPNGTSIEAFKSAVIGGEGGYPQSLISLSSGRLPGDEAGFLTNPSISDIENNQTYLVGFSESFFGLNNSDQYMQFNATAVGAVAENPMEAVLILWNSTFLQQQLGSQLYNETFGGNAANYFIIQVQDLSQTGKVAGQLQKIFADYPQYSVVYDQSDLNSLQSFESQSGVLYGLIGAISLFSVVSLVFLFTYIFSGRRKWEAGLLVTQGWSWNRVTNLFLSYYLFLGAISAVLSTALAFFIGSQIGYSYQLYGSTVVIPLIISPYLLASGLLIALLVSFVAAYFAVWNMRKIGLDNILREC